MTAYRLKTSLVAASGVLALGLAACEEDGYSRIAVPDPAPAAYLSDPMGLPYAEPARVDWHAPEEGYRWAERAYGLQRAFYEVPPDYAFAYDSVQPWGWETYDEWAMYAEPWDDGYRYYYYEPGAAYPFFVRDGRYGYGFDALGLLVALFDLQGNYLPASYLYDVAPLAGRYYVRGRDLRNAAFQATPILIQETVWIERAPLILASADPWIRAATYDPEWVAYRARFDAREFERFRIEEKRRETVKRTWARELRRDDDFQRRYAAAAEGRDEERDWRRAAERGREDQQRRAERGREDRQRVVERQPDDQRQVAERAREDRQRVVERQREEQRQAAERARGSQQRQAERAREERQRVVERQRDEQRQVAQRAREDQQRRAERAREAERRQAAERQREAQRQVAEQRRQAAERAQAEGRRAERAREEQRRAAEIAREERRFVEQQRAAQEQRRHERQEQQRAERRSAEAQGRPAAAVERGDGGGQGRGAGQGRGGGDKGQGGPKGGGQDEGRGKGGGKKE